MVMEPKLNLKSQTQTELNRSHPPTNYDVGRNHISFCLRIQVELEVLYTAGMLICCVFLV